VYDHGLRRLIAPEALATLLTSHAGTSAPARDTRIPHTYFLVFDFFGAPSALDSSISGEPVCERCPG